METTLTQITNYLATQSWQIAVLAAAIAGVSLLLKNKSAHVRYLLWLIVLAKCLTPPLLTIPLAVLPQQQAPQPLAAVPAEIEPLTIEPVRPVIYERPATLPSAPPVIERPSIGQRLSVFAARYWLPLTWIAGLALFFSVALIKAFRTNSWLRQARRPLPAGLQKSIDKLFDELDIRRPPRLWLVKDIGQPFVWGLLRGGIYLPADFAKLDSARHRRGILGHELSHVLRFDAAVNLLQIIVQAVFWFHPFVWWANKKIRAEREKCCDEMAIARLNAKAKDYSTAIVNTLIAEHRAAKPIPSLAVAGPVKNIEDRIKTILSPDKKFYKRPTFIVIVAVALAAAITVPTTLALTSRPPKKTDVQVESEKPKDVLKHSAEVKEAAKQLFEKIRSADYDYFLRSKKPVWSKFPIGGHYMTHTRWDKLVEWICKTFKGNPIVSVELGEVFIGDKEIKGKTGWPTVPYKLTLRDGGVLEGDLAFEYNFDGGVGHWHGMEGIDWHLQDEPIKKRDVQHEKQQEQFTANLPNGVTIEDSRNLLMERRDILQKTLQTVEQKYNNGRANSRQLQEAKIDLLRIESELAETPQKRIDILNQIVTLYLEQEKTTKLLLDAGRVTQGELNKVKLLRLDAENEFARAKAEGNEQQTDFKAILPNKVTVELVGVCDYSGEKQSWWQPNGKAFQPEQKLEIEDVSSEYNIGFLAKFNTNDFKARFETEKARSYYGMEVYDLSDQKLRNYWGAVFKNLDKTDIAKLRIGVATGKWQTVAEYKDNVFSNRDVIFTKPIESKDGVVIAARGEWGFDGERRFIAIDKNGMVHNGSWSGHSSGDKTIATGTFRSVNSKQIEKYEIRFRPYEWVTFKNVSLKPNFKTDVEVETLGGKGDYLRVYEVNRRVSDFPEEDDLSTPEAAYATIRRISASGEKHRWADVSTEKIAERFKEMDDKDNIYIPADMAELLLNTQIMEVRIYDKCAAVIAKLPLRPDGTKAPEPIEYREFLFEEGRWLFAGRGGRFETLEEARELFTASIKEIMPKADVQFDAEQDQSVFESYFPDDAEAGKMLDEWWKNKESTDLAAEAFFELFRSGLRRCTVEHKGNFLMQHIGGRYIWRKEPDDERVLDIVYHASFNPEYKYYAVYSGLSVANPKSEKVLKRLVEIALEYHQLARIIWGVKGSKQEDEFLALLEPYLNGPDEQQREHAEIVKKAFRGEIDADRWEKEWNQMRDTARTIREFGDDLPKIKKTFLAGTSEERLEAIQFIRQNQISLFHDSSFISALGECAKDEDANVRAETAGLLGGNFIWGQNIQPDDAIEILLRLAQDENSKVRNRTVYYGLSVVKHKDPKILKRLAEFCVNYEETDISRIIWGVKATRQAEEFAELLRPYLNSTDTEIQKRAETVIQQLTENAAEPERKPTNEGVYRQLEKIFDFSELSSEMHFADALDAMKNSVEPPLNVFVFWNDLYKEADVDKTSPIHIDSDAKVPLKMAFNLLLDSVSGGFGDLTYTVANGLIYIGPKQSLRKKVKTSTHHVSDVIGPPATATIP